MDITLRMSDHALTARAAAAAGIVLLQNKNRTLRRRTVRRCLSRCLASNSFRRPLSTKR